MEKFDLLDGKYEVLEKLHEGGMGAIYKVRHRLLDEIRVIKVMRPQNEENEGLRARFLREAQMAVKLRHPHVAQMYDFAFDESGRGFIVMEYVEGISLQQMIERTGAPSLRLSLDLARQILKAVGFLHRKGIVHRDISPDNIMVAWDDMGRPMVKLIDLGIAKAVTSTTGLTVSGTFLGKFLYASPEQFGTAGGEVDQRSDIYSLGVVLYELFTGRHPFPGATPQELIAGHLLKAPLEFAVSDHDGRVPDDLREIVLKAMTKKREERYASAEALDAALAAVQTRFPLDPDEFTRVLQEYDSNPTVMRNGNLLSGSTQQHIAAQFQLALTPQPISSADAQEASSTAQTLPLPTNGSAVTDTMSEGEASRLTAPPSGTHPTSNLPEDSSGSSVVAEEAATRNGIPVAAAPAGPTQSAATPRPSARTQAPWLLLAAGCAVAIIAVALILGRATQRPKARPAAMLLPAETVPAPQALPTAEPVAPSTPRADLEKAIAVGNVERLRTLLESMSDAELAALEAEPDGTQRLDLARRSVDTDSALGELMTAKNWAAALQEASVLVTLLPADRQARQARETAAAALETQAMALVQEGQTDAALAKLSTVQRAWPNRAGLETRLAGVRSAVKTGQAFATALSAAEAAEKERRPEKGLEALAQTAPDAHWQERFAAAQRRLESLLAELDKTPPVVRLKPGSKMSYSKGKTFTVTFVVTDDYRVRSVTVMARQEGASAYQELAARSTGDDEYTVEVTPEFHGNKTVELYLVAMDYAGHSSQLGSPDQPLRVKKRWLF